MSRKIILSIVIVLLCALPLLLMTRPGNAAPIEESDPAEQILQLVNDWRIQEGLWPLRQNAALTTMAQAQAEYIAPRIENISDEIDFHKDAQGRLPSERARQDHQWPLIGGTNAAATVRVGENAAVGSVKYALAFWKGSDIHRRAALNNVYQDVGVGVVPYKAGYVFIMDFGTRPDGIAVLTSLRGDKLYLGNDCLCGQQRGEIANTKIRVFNSSGAPLTGTLDWKPVLGIDATWGSTLTVLYTNGTQQKLVSVTVGKDIAILPRTSSMGGAVPTLTPTPIPLPVLFQGSPTPTVGKPSGASTAIPAVTSTIAPTATPVPLQTTAAPKALPDLILLYSGDTFLLYNNNARSVDISGVAVGNATSRLSMTSWKAVATFTDTVFPNASCLQAGTGTTLPQNTCKYTRSSVYLQASKMFWLAGTFKVTQNDAPVGECQASAKRCEIWLKFAVSANQSTSGKQ